jgi:hypothetical protein
LSNLTDHIFYFNSWWIGLDDNIKYSDFNGKIWDVSIDSNFQETISQVDLVDPTNVETYRGLILLRLNDEIIIVHETGAGTIGYNPNGGPILEIATIKNAVNSSDFYYLSGNNDSNQPVLQKVNPMKSSNFAAEILLSPNLFDIYKMTVNNDNVITFNAKRISDGVKVIGQVSSVDEVSILDETLNTEIFIFERIR